VSVAHAVRVPIEWLDRHPATATLAGVLGGVFALQRLAGAMFGPGVVVYAFGASVHPSPGWLLSTFSHVSVDHFAVNLFVFAVYGALLEERTSGPQVLVLFVLTGLSSTMAQVAWYAVANPGGVAVGASGGVFAVVACFTVLAVALRYRGDRLSPQATIYGALGVPLVALQLLNDFHPAVTLSPNTGAWGHLAGVLLGAAWALVVVRQG
jgi:membrane associated rhomboid family serine protease